MVYNRFGRVNVHKSSGRKLAVANRKPLTILQTTELYKVVVEENEKHSEQFITTMTKIIDAIDCISRDHKQKITNTLKLFKLSFPELCRCHENEKDILPADEKDEAVDIWLAALQHISANVRDNVIYN